MKKNIIFLFSFLLALIVSCNTNSSQPENKISQTKKQAKKFELKTTFTTTKAGIFRSSFFITKDDSRRITTDFFDDLASSGLEKTLTYTLNENQFPSAIYLGLGTETPKKIKVSSMQLVYGDRKINFNGKEIANYFDLNKFIDLDTIKGEITTKTIDGTHTPTLTLKQEHLDYLSNNENLNEE